MKVDFQIKFDSSLQSKLDMDKYINSFSEATERQVHESSNKTARNAPRKSGALANSFPASVEMTSDLQGQFGSDLDYAGIQEYTHKTKSGFVRKTVQEDAPAYRNKLKAAVKRTSN
ncbi:HK97 gp10 family phage protein [Listeria monocytogenes]